MQYKQDNALISKCTEWDRNSSTLHLPTLAFQWNRWEEKHLEPKQRMYALNADNTSETQFHSLRTLEDTVGKTSQTSHETERQGNRNRNSPTCIIITTLYLY